MDFYEWLIEVFNKQSDPSNYASQQFGGNPADYPKLGSGGQKTTVQMPGNNVARFYHDQEELPYGSSEGRITDLLKNDKIAPKIQFIKGKGYDIVEKVVDVYKIMIANVYKPMIDNTGQQMISSKSGKPMKVSLTVQDGPNQHKNPNLTALQELAKSFHANPLFKYNMVEASPIESSGYGKNVGIVVRNGYVYAVAYDLDGLFDETDRVKFNAASIKKIGASAKPYGIPLKVFEGTMFAKELGLR